MSKKGIVILTVIIVFILSIVIGNKIRNKRIDNEIHVINVSSYMKDLSVSDDSLTIDWEKYKVNYVINNPVELSETIKKLSDTDNGKLIEKVGNATYDEFIESTD